MFKLSSRSSRNNKVFCKRHPKHPQTTGVCSLCLTEKLSRVSTSGTSRYTKSRARAYYCSSSSASSSEDTSYASSTASPVYDDGHHRRNLSDVKVESSRNDHLNGFLKSRSTAFAANEDAKLRAEEKKNKVISGFWAKLVRPRRNDNVFTLTQSQALASTSSSMVVY